MQEPKKEDDHTSDEKNVKGEDNTNIVEHNPSSVESSKDMTDYSQWTSEHKRILYMVCKKTGLSDSEAYMELMKHEGDYNKVITHHNIRNMIDIVVNQTDYTKEESYEKLVHHKGDILAIIREYMCIPVSKKEKDKSVNQKVFSEIRNFMDVAIDGYNKRKEKDDFFQNLKK